MCDSLQIGFWLVTQLFEILNFKDSQIVFKIKDLNNSVTMNHFLFK